jgi:hypothetical protein
MKMGTILCSLSAMTTQEKNMFEIILAICTFSHFVMTPGKGMMRKPCKRLGKLHKPELL